MKGQLYATINGIDIKRIDILLWARGIKAKFIVWKGVVQRKTLKYNWIYIEFSQGGSMNPSLTFFLPTNKQGFKC